MTQTEDRLSLLERRAEDVSIPLYNSTPKLVGIVNDLEASTGITFTRSGRHGLIAVSLPAGLELSVSGGSVAVPVNTVKDIIVPYACTVTDWTLLVEDNVSDTAAVDVLSSANGGAPNYVSMVGAGTKPNIAASVGSGLVAPSGWTTTSIAANTIVQMKVTTAPATAKGLLLSLQVKLT